MIDSLLQFLLEEVAMDGDAGTSVASLGGFVEQFYDRASSGLDQPSTSDGTRAQRVDDAFLSFVWDALLSQPGVRVGILSELAAPAAEEPKVEDQGDQDGAPPAGEGEGEEAKIAKGKGKRKKIERKPQGPTHEVRIIEGDEREEGRAALQERYGDNLRILAGEETAWVAITGSHARPTSLTPTIYAVLQMISRGRDEGTTAVRISKEMGIDPKSVFHYIKVPQQLGIIKKFNDIDEGSRTNRVVHVRYLSTSEAWAAHIASDPDIKDEEDGDEGGEDGADAGFGGGWDGNELTPISTLYLTTNVPLIQKRVVKALKRRKDWWMPHWELHTAIGLHTASSRELRRLNTIISGMANEGIVEKIAVTKRKSATQSSVVQALRLLKWEEVQEGSTGREEADSAEDDADEDEHACPVATRALERQILDLLIDAGSRGLTNFEISSALGAYPVRFIDVLLQRFGRYPPPGPLADYTIHSVHETIGRVKQTRWFSLVGYLSFRRARGFPDEDMEAQWRKIVDGASLGGWMTPEGEGPIEGQYGSVKQRHAHLAKFNLWATTAQSVTGVAKKSKAKAPPKKRKAATIESGADGADQPADGEAEEEEEQEDASPPPKKGKGPIGRPRKHPLKPGEETYYMRKKREKAEDEERARQGLPPLERSKPPRKTPKRKPKTEEIEETVGGAVSQVEAGSSGTAQGAAQPAPPAGKPAAPKKRGRPPKKKVASAETATGGDAAPASSTSDAFVTPVVKSRKRSRAAESSTPATPATPTASKAKSASRSRLEPYIDIVTGPASKKKKAVVKKALDALAGIHSSSPARGDGPASPVGSAADERVEPAASTSAAQASKAPSEVPPDKLVQGSAASPAAARTAPATPSATPAASIRLATPVLPTPASKHKSRPSVASRANLTLLARQQEVIDYIQAQGGVIEHAYRLNDALYAWGQKQNPPRSDYLIDRPVLKQVLEAATSAGKLRKTTFTDDRPQRHDIYYLPTLDSDSEVVKQLIEGVVNRSVQSRFTMYEVQPDLVLSDDEGGVRAKGGKKLKAQQDDAGDMGLPDPQPTDGHDRVRDFFHQQQTILGRAHGVKHGLVARARQLHKWLASLVFSQADEKDVVVKSDEDGFVIAQSTLLNLMPLGVFLRIVPLPVQSEALDAFLAEPDNLELPMRDVPKEITDIVRPRSNKRKQSLWNDLQLLIDLKLLAPLVAVSTPLGASPTSEVPANPKACTHWRFLTRVPIYAMRDPALPLVDVCPVTTVDEVLYFWTRLYTVSTDTSFANAGPPLDDSAFPATYSSTRHLRKHELLKQFKWRDSYGLAPSQRTFLTKLVHHDPDLINPDKDRTAGLDAWAACLLAPTDVVKDYLCRVRDQEAKQVERPTRKKRKTEGGAEVGDGDGEEIGEAKTPTNLAAALARKVREAADQRERDWQVIVERFRQEHGQPDLDESIVDWLHKTFQDPRRRDKLDAKQLDFELCRLLPAGQTAQTDPSMRTIVPISLQQKARLAKDPYAIKRQPNIRRRPLVKRVRAKEAPRAKQTAGEEGEEDEDDEDEAGSPAPGQFASPVSSAKDRQAPLPFHRGDQSEFLTNPLGPRPDLPAGKRASRSRYTPEQDELLLDAIAVLKVRALHLRAPRPSYNPLGDFFPGNKADALVKRAATLLKRQSERDFHERLVSTWFDVYKDHKAELEDPNPDSLVDFDLASFIRCMRTHVNKRALRLMGPLPPPLVKADPLPVSLDDLARYHVKPTTEAVQSGRQFDKVWTKHQIAINEREEAALLAAYAKRWTGEPAKDDPHDCKHELAMSAIKAIMAMDEASYLPAQGVAMLSQFSTNQIKGALDELGAKHIAAQLDKEHRLPGRNFAFDNRFFDRLSFHLDLAHLQTASHFEQDLNNDEGGDFPLVPTEGEMMALFDLVSDDKVELTADLSELSDKTLDFLDYRTRQANDDDIECTITITQPAGLSGKAVLPQPSFLPSTCTSDPAVFEAAKAALSSAGGDLELDLVSEIEAAGESGLPFAILTGPHGDRRRDAILSAVEHLTTGPQPLAFFAGASALVLVANVHLGSWTLQPVLDDGSIHNARRFLPMMWTNAKGEVDQELWQRAGAWVKGELWRFANQTYPSLLARATRLNVLSALDLQAILAAFLRAGKVSRRSPLTGELLAADDPVDWDLDTWSFEGAFW